GSIHLDHEVLLPAIQDLPEMLQLRLAHVELATLDDIRLNVTGAGQQASRLNRVAVVGVSGRLENGVRTRRYDYVTRRTRLWGIEGLGIRPSSLPHLYYFFRRGGWTGRNGLCWRDRVRG